MRIEELSVGDFLFFTDGDCAVCVQEIYNDAQLLVSDGDSISEPVHITHLIPIPLTPEILEKNGFVKNGEYNEWNIGTWETPYLLGVSLERPAITIKWNGSSIFIDQAKYVHQLHQRQRSVFKRIFQ